MLYYNRNNTLMSSAKCGNLGTKKYKYIYSCVIHNFARRMSTTLCENTYNNYNELSRNRYIKLDSIKNYRKYYEKPIYALNRLITEIENQPITGGNRKMIQEIKRITGINSVTDAFNLVTNNKLYNNLEDYAESMITSKLKSTFGKEYYISNATNITNEYNAALFKFLSKFDPKLDKHYDSSTGSIVPFVGLYKIDKATYMFISTYQFIPTNKVANNMSNEDKIHADIYIYIFGKKSRKYCKLLDKCLDLRLTSNINDLIYSVNSIGANGGTDISCIKLSKRKMSSLIYSNDEYKRVMDHVSQFIKGKSFYAEKELSYKTGILLYGSPGTGKSTMAKVLATEFHRAIVSIDMANINHIDFAKLSMMISNEKDEKYIVLLEDIDTLYNLDRAKEEEVKKEDKEVINKLLQFLDSTQSPSDVIFIATTNYVEKLDAALIRDGRFDLKVEVKELYRKDVKKFVETFDMDPEITEDIIKDYCEGNPEPKTFNQAKLQNVILRRIKYDKIMAQSNEDKKIENKIEQYQEEAQKIVDSEINDEQHEVKEETA